MTTLVLPDADRLRAEADLTTWVAGAGWNPETRAAEAELKEVLALYEHGDVSDALKRSAFAAVARRCANGAYHSKRSAPKDSSSNTFTKAKRDKAKGPRLEPKPAPAQQPVAPEMSGKMIAFARTKMNDACWESYDSQVLSPIRARIRELGDDDENARQAKVYLFLARSEATGVYGDTCYGHWLANLARAHVNLLNMETVLEQGEKFDYLNKTRSILDDTEDAAPDSAPVETAKPAPQTVRPAPVPVTVAPQVSVSVEELMRTARHESAHAGCVIFSGCRLGPVVVRPDGSGECVWYRNGASGAHNQALVALAPYFRASSCGLPTDGCWEDLESVARAVAELSGKPVTAQNVLCTDEVRETEQLLDGLLNCMGPIIERFANVLVDASPEPVSGEVLTKLYREWEESKPWKSAW